MMSKMFFIIWLSPKKIRKNNKDKKLGMYNIKVVHLEFFCLQEMNYLKILNIIFQDIAKVIIIFCIFLFQLKL